MKSQNHTRKTLLGPATLIICIASIFAGCASNNAFPRKKHVGDTFEVIGNLCIIDELLKDEELTSVEGWQAHSEKFHKRFVKLPLGTRIKIVSVEKISNWTWNNGFYSYYIVWVNVLGIGKDGVRYNASHLMHGDHREQFGNDGRKLVTLKFISTEKQK